MDVFYMHIFSKKVVYKKEGLKRLKNKKKVKRATLTTKKTVL